MVCNYLAVILYNAIVQVNRKFHDIELAQDEARRSLFEENQLHVQNMVLDNCLSTIKHETIYYPSRIKQVADKLNGEVTAAQRTELLENMSELVGITRIYLRSSVRVLRVSWRRLLSVVRKWG